MMEAEEIAGIQRGNLEERTMHGSRTGSSDCSTPLGYLDHNFLAWRGLRS
jgi:hypothetical protein